MIAVALLLWLAAAVWVALLLGGVLRARDRQVPTEARATAPGVDADGTGRAA